MAKNLYNSEEDWMDAIRHNDSQALEVLYKSFFPSVNHFILNNNGNEEDARDVFQESVIVFLEKLKAPGFTLQCKLKTYIFSIARLMWLKKLKRNSIFSGRPEDVEPFVALEHDYENWEEKENQFNRMKAAMQDLGEPCRSLIEDFYVNRLSMVEISEKFGYSNPGNAKNQKYKCLMRLKKIYFKESNIRLVK